MKRLRYRKGTQSLISGKVCIANVRKTRKLVEGDLKLFGSVIVERENAPKGRKRRTKV